MNIKNKKLALSIGCMHPQKYICEDGGELILRPILYIPYDPDFISQLNIEQYELSKTGELLFNPHPMAKII
jgi:hypothetical protein